MVVYHNQLDIEHLPPTHQTLMFTLSKENRINAIIPDQDSLTDVIYINKEGNIQDIKISIAIQHPYMKDLSIKLLSPTGQEVVLQDENWEFINDLNKTYEGELLQSFHGISAKGTWTLTVEDSAADDQGILEAWTLDLTCQEFETFQSEVFIAESEEKAPLLSTQECRFSGRVTKAEAEIELEHPQIENLTISIIAPSGKEVILRDRIGNNQKVLYKTWSSISLKNFIGEPVQGTWILKINSFHNAPTGALKHWKIRFHYVQEDDLKMIEGIGLKIEETLKREGIYSFVDLATTSTEKLKNILKSNDILLNLEELHSSWPKQALLAAQERWVDLEAFKKEQLETIKQL